MQEYHTMADTPKKLTVRITRFRDNGLATYGVIAVYRGSEQLAQKVLLEPSALFNLKYVSCIPCGLYHVRKRHTPRFGHHFEILNVPGRTHILMHAGNLYKDTEGCLIPGEYFGYVNNDAVLDVKGSTQAMNELNSVLPDEFQIQVLEHEQMQRFYHTQKPATAQNPL